MSCRFHSLLQSIGIKVPPGTPNPLIENLSSDSRSIPQNTLFLGVPGQKVDGGFFWPQSKSAGALCAVISQSAFEAFPPHVNDAVVVLPDPVEKWIGELASSFWGYPSKQIDLIGVTGTNGKTTITHLIEYLCNSIGRPSAIFGTLVNRWPMHSEVSIHTTDFADSLQAKLSKVVQARVEIAAIEVSSHSLVQNRVAGCQFSGAVFTNLTQDHLDFHPSMDAYFEAKASLFKSPFLVSGRGPRSVVNIDNVWGKKLALFLQDSCWKSSLYQSQKAFSEADLYITNLKMNEEGAKGIVHSPLGSGEFQSPLIGKFNVMNALQSLGILLQHGLPLDELLQALSSFPGVAGRMQRVVLSEISDDFRSPTVLVDYAHTPDALLNALTSLDPFIKGSVICVFGCGGDRDRDKRSKMGAIASQYADKIIITSDNPRTEDPFQIIGDIISGITTNSEVIVEVNRSKAIQTAINLASSEDLVLIAGKGHEDYQIFGKTKKYFDDREEASHALKNKSTL